MFRLEWLPLPLHFAKDVRKFTRMSLSHVRQFNYFVYSKQRADDKHYGAEGVNDLAEVTELIQSLKQRKTTDVVIVDSRSAIFQVIQGYCYFIIENLKRRYPGEVKEGIIVSHES